MGLVTCPPLLTSWGGVKVKVTVNLKQRFINWKPLSRWGVRTRSKGCSSYKKSKWHVGP